MDSAWSARTGRGSCEHFGLGADDVPVLVGTFGKAFGTFGAFVAGDADLIEFLMQKSRTYIYTTALPPAVAAATRAALRVSQRESWRREKVLALAQRFRRGLRATASGVNSRHPVPGTTIVPVIVGDDGARAGGQQGARRQGVSRHGDPPADGAGGHRAPARHVVGGARGSAGRRADRRASRRRSPHEHARSARRFSRSIAARSRRPSIAPAPATTRPRRCRNACATSCSRVSTSSKLAPQAILDLGAGTGHASRALKRRYPQALVVAADIAPGMLSARESAVALAAPLRARARRRVRAAVPRRQLRSGVQQPDAAVVRRPRRGVRRDRARAEARRRCCCSALSAPARWPSCARPGRRATPPAIT